MIPKVFHRVWFGGEIPDEFEGYWAKLREFHPCWAFFTWRDEVFPTRYQTTSLSSAADVARLELLWNYGGVYVDVDVEALSSFDALLDQAQDRAFAAYEDETWLCPAVLGSPMHHPALRAALKQLQTTFRYFNGTPDSSATGPQNLTHAWKDRKDVLLLSPDVFYPRHWNGEERFSDETLAVHHWAASWPPA